MTTAPARLARWPVWSAVGVLLVVLAAVSARYGYHRDELYFRLLPLRWGYVDQPPMAPVVVHLFATLADQVWAIRIPAALLAAGGVLVVVAIARELGAGPLGQGLTAWGFAFGTMTLTFGHLMLTASFDLVLWPAILLAVIRVVRRGEPRWWLLAGGLVGVGTYDKWLVVSLVLGVLVGLLVAGPRSVLRTRWLALAALLAVVLALPNVVYQIGHGLPQLDMGAALRARNGDSVRTTLGPLLLIMVGPLVCWVWILGIVRLLRDPRLRSVRFLVVSFAVVLVLTFAGGAQVYYPYPVLAVLFAVGCVVLEPWLHPARRRRAVLVVFALGVVSNIVINLPVIPVTTIGQTPVVVLNQTVGDQVGWPTYVAQIDAVTAEARAQDPEAVVLASNYGEAGALSRFGRLSGVPVVSGHNALWDLGPPPVLTRTVVVVGGQLDQVRPFFSSCTVRARLDNGLGVDNEEQGEPVAVCSGPERDWPWIWAQLRHLG